MSWDDLTDVDLAARARTGEDQAFSALMRRHKAGLFAFVRRYIADTDAAVDVVQETFVSAWRALGRFDEKRAFGVWLRAIALNKCRDRARRMMVRRFILGEKDDQSPEALAQADPTPSSEAGMMQGEEHAALRRAIASLPAQLKEPLLLTYLDAMSQQEAADILGITPKAVETRVRRARLKLAEILSLDAD